MKKIFILFMAIALLGIVHGQNDFINKAESNFSTFLRILPHEKIYLQTDKDSYVTEERIWFSAYLVEASRHVLSPYSKYVYVELIDQRERLIQRVKIGVRDSSFSGYIDIPPELMQGEYSLRAFTYYMQNMGDEYIFHKKIYIINPKEFNVITNVSYKKESDNKYMMNVRFLDNRGNPYSRVALHYNTKVEKGREPGSTQTDKDGNFSIAIDTNLRFLNLSFKEGVPFPFERNIYIPKLQDDYDVQFFPEGGNLLNGNRQYVAFKAIGKDGHSVNVSGKVFMDDTEIARVTTQHEGMGKFLLPVNNVSTYKAIIVSEDGLEKEFTISSPVAEGYGISVEQNSERLQYSVKKSAFPKLNTNLYLLFHCRGRLLGISRVFDASRGFVNLEELPEGINHIVLMDENYHVHSERLFFVRNKKPIDITITPDHPSYGSRELVNLELNINKFDLSDISGQFSMSVTDDKKVSKESGVDNILSSILLTSDLKGHIENPGYYFDSITPQVDSHLDLVMMTHGWTRFEVSDVARERWVKPEYEMEVGQVISGKVTNTWGKDSRGASVIIISNSGHFAATETDSEGRFLVDEFVFHDTTEFILQTLNEKGRKSVEFTIDDFPFIKPRFNFLNNRLVKEKTEYVPEKSYFDHYYENGEKIYLLDEVIVNRQRKRKYSFYDKYTHTTIDSARIAEVAHLDISALLSQLPGVTFPGDYVLRFGKQTTVFINDLRYEDGDGHKFLRTFPVEAIINVSLLDVERAKFFFGVNNGAVLITLDPNYENKGLPRTHIKSFKLAGIQTPAEFYVPKYEIDSIKHNKELDERSTIYWNPNIKLTREEPTKVSFYTADVSGTYTVILEGVTNEGIVCRKRMKLLLK